MNRNHTMALTALGGVLIGLTAARMIDAQHAKSPAAYVIAEVEKDPTKADDPVAARKYTEEAPKSLTPFGGRYLIAGGKVQTVEGESPRGYIVVIAFESLEKARGWYYSPDYEAIKPIRQNSTKSRLLIVEGVVPPEQGR